MGITNFSISLLEKVVKKYNPKTVIELGSQNLYTTNQDPPPFADTWYKDNGFIEYACIDLAGDNNAMKLDLAYPIEIKNQYDLVTDFGSGEHIVQMEGYESTSFHEGHIHSVYPTKIKSIEQGYYNGWLNKSNLCKKDGIIISENPKTGSWPDHGYSYLSVDFYYQLSNLTGWEIIDVGEHAASGNFVDGWNIFCILKKTTKDFISFEDFQMLDIKPS